MCTICKGWEKRGISRVLWIFKKIIDIIARIAIMYGLTLILAQNFICRFYKKQAQKMTLNKKGEWNLKLVEILDSQEFLEMSHFPKENLCSLIINRLYLGCVFDCKGQVSGKRNYVNQGIEFRILEKIIFGKN